MRLLKFFDSACIPLFTFHVNMTADHLWRTHLPPLFAKLKCVRNAVFAFACLNLWRFVNVDQVLLEESKNWEAASEGEFDHVYRSDAVVKGETLFTTTHAYFQEAISETSRHIGEKTDSSFMEGPLFFSSLLVYAYLGLHPYSVLPLVLWEENVADFISIAVALRRVFAETSFQSSFEGLVFDAYSATMRRTVVGEVLKSELFDLFDFSEATSESCHDFEVVKQVIGLLDKCIASAIERGYPVPMYRFLFMLTPDFKALIKGNNWLALRTLFIYCVFAIYGGFHLLMELNMWREFAQWFVENQDMSFLDRGLYDYVVKREREVDFSCFSKSLSELDELTKRFSAGEEAPIGNHFKVMGNSEKRIVMP